MFYFGDPEQIAQSFIDALADPSVSGPGFDPKPLDEMTLQELKNHLVYLRIACNLAITAEAPKEAVDFLVFYHDEAFKYLVMFDEAYRQRVGGKGWFPPQGQGIEFINKYRAMAGHPLLADKTKDKERAKELWKELVSNSKYSVSVKVSR